METFTHTNTYDYKKILENSRDWDIPTIEKEKIKEFANEYANGRITGRIGKNVNGSIQDTLYKLKLPLSYINKPVEKITEKDLKNFVDDLFQDKIKKKVRKNVKGKLKFVDCGNYEKKGKDKFLKTFTLYLKFRLKDNPKKFLKLKEITKIIIIHEEKEVESLSDEKFKEIYDDVSTLSDRYYLQVNAWGGYRASEFHGITALDITLPNLSKEESFVKIWVRHGNSKTKGRMTSLYGPKCYKIVREYLEQRKKEGIKPDEPLFEKTHNSRKLWLRRLSKKYKIRLYPHLFRSTAATWLVDKGILKDYTDLCMFFGWAFGSSIPSKYLNRSKIKLKTIDDKVKKTNFDKLESEIENREEIHRIERIKSDKKIEFLQQSFNQMQEMVKTALENQELKKQNKPLKRYKKIKTNFDNKPLKKLIVEDLKVI